MMVQVGQVGVLVVGVQYEILGVVIGGIGSGVVGQQGCDVFDVVGGVVGWL